jgi:hypothetical protein
MSDAELNAIEGRIPNMAINPIKHHVRNQSSPPLLVTKVIC